MHYCPPNVTLGHMWTREGLSQCFLDTVGPPVLLFTILVGGGIQWAVYHKYATRLDTRLLHRRGCYKFHTSLMMAMATSCLIRLAVVSGIGGAPLEGHQLVWALCMAPAWLLSVLLTRLERHWALPSTPTHGHGLPLLIFWAMGVIHEAMAFLGLYHPSWWFQVHSRKDIADMVFFAARFILSVLVFGIGLKGPSVPSVQDYFLYSRGHIQETQPLLDEENGNGSPFRGFKNKVRLLLPFLWPKRNCRLQLVVVVCVALLVSGRVVNLFIPMLNRLVVNSLAAQGTIIFPWQDILLYVFLWCLQGQGTALLESPPRL